MTQVNGVSHVLAARAPGPLSYPAEAPLDVWAMNSLPHPMIFSEGPAMSRPAGFDTTTIRCSCPGAAGPPIPRWAPQLAQSAGEDYYFPEGPQAWIGLDRRTR